MREQAPGAKLLHDSVSGASSLVCTEICFAGACFRSKLPRVYCLGYLPGSMFRERVSGASFFVCTGWSTYPGACFRSKLPRVYRPYKGAFVWDIPDNVYSGHIDVVNVRFLLRFQ